MAEKTHSQKRPSRPKSKRTAKSAATERIAERRGTAPPVRVPSSHKQISQSRFPGETPSGR